MAKFSVEVTERTDRVAAESMQCTVIDSVTSDPDRAPTSCTIANCSPVAMQCTIVNSNVAPSAMQCTIVNSNDAVAMSCAPPAPAAFSCAPESPVATGVSAELSPLAS